MKVAFLTEMAFEGKVAHDHPNLRTEFAWMAALDADHRNIHLYRQVKGYDHVFIIFPKGKTFLSAEGSTLVKEKNPVSELLREPIAEVLKKYNTKVHYIQEGPHWWFNDYEVSDQIYFYNLVAQCDTVLAHNNVDVQYYAGMFPSKPVQVIPSLMLEHSVAGIKPAKLDKAIIGGNFSRWYGGFESYVVASNFKVPIWTQTSHARREEESLIANLNHLPRLIWVQWMKALSEFKYAVHLMPTVAAGTFSLNCAYFGIPCIGNQEVDTQSVCHPQLAIKVSNIQLANELAKLLATDKDFYNKCSDYAKKAYHETYSLAAWKIRMSNIL